MARANVPEILVAGAVVDGFNFFFFQRHTFAAAFVPILRAAFALAVSANVIGQCRAHPSRFSEMLSLDGIRHPRAAHLARVARFKE